MSFTPFAADRGPIVLRGRITGPAQALDVRLALDTGATSTVIHLPVLLALGFDPDRDGRPVRVITASSVEVATSVTLTRLFALGQNRLGFPVVAHALPAGAAVDGLLGLDFLRGHVLTLDFRAGSIALA